MFTTENFISGLQTATNIVVEEQATKIILTRVFHDLDSSEEDRMVIGEIPITEITMVIAELETGYSYNDNLLSTAASFEVAVQAHDHMRSFAFRPDRSMYTLSEHNYEFELSKASAKYILALLCYSSTNPSFDLDIGPLRLYREESVTSIEGFLELFRIFTVKISGVKQNSTAEFKRMLYSYLFNISYNYHIALSVADFSENRRAFRRRARRSGQLFPYKLYNQELTRYYYQAIATDMPFTQYLAFYHVAEFFFQSISEQDAFYEIESFITHPSFSPYKKEDIKRFYNMIKKKMREQRDDGVWNEKTGLILCLKKYMPDLASLKLSIDAIDSSAIDYYKSTLVEFADDSKKINFDETAEKIYKDICDRVYSIRNAIVHSKEGDRLRYEPFRHDKQLAKEIPLIRCIAEEIIINSAKTIEHNFE